MTQPRLTLIAGPNGAGKSTLTRTLGNLGMLIDPDAIARELNPQAPETVPGPAGREALSRANDCIERRISFAQETTLSGNSTARLIDRAKSAGFTIDLRYVGIPSAESSETRVSRRVELGGQAIPVDDIYRRYQRSMDALPIILTKVDTATLYDNSRRTGHYIAATFADGAFTSIAPDAPAWATTAIAKFEESMS